ncbi:Cof-type HAD-IIB family hydrolase [Streptococcus sp. DD12]|uniref:Cof-type HAD-IIB family hydrolase n=1 Tax=Streptococcus sp. DD12 TaxID=1777880 RepID=UPI000793A094|nr:Cof-type HAD-IIB family hydrolase [Streptococcus sp. DD12]KXT75215.1 hypothetical protein STRDD12_01565 [Streptococcus sp. DD12]
MAVIFLDVDGTLVDYHNRIPESAVGAIQTARANGHKVYVSTGRSRAEMPEKIWAIGLDGMIGGNGSYVEDRGQVIMHQVIPQEQAHAVVDWLQARGLDFYLESNNGLFASPNFREAGRPVLQHYALGKGKTQEQVHDLQVEDLMHGMVFGGNLYRDDLNKVSFILKSYQDFLEAKQAFPDLKAGTWGGRGEEALFGDLGVKDITKAHAIEVLLQHLGVDKSQTIAFGDAKVDIPMLDYCQIGVAMGNGGPEIKAMADKIVADVEHDGLYQGFKELGLL